MNTEDTNNPGYQQPVAKSNKGLFACGGIGCLLLFLVCGGGIAAVTYMGMGVFQVWEEAKSAVSDNKAVIDALGEPLEFGPQPVQNTEGDQAAGEVGWDLPVKGPNGSGTVKMITKFKSFSEWSLEGLRVDVEGGDDINVLETSEIELDIEDVGGDEDAEVGDTSEDSSE